jgi:hypothetical protein
MKIPLLGVGRDRWARRPGDMTRSPVVTTTAAPTRPAVAPYLVAGACELLLTLWPKAKRDVPARFTPPKRAGDVALHPQTATP